MTGRIYHGGLDREQQPGETPDAHVDYAERTGTVTRVGITDAATEQDAIAVAEEHMRGASHAWVAPYSNGIEVVFENAYLLE